MKVICVLKLFGLKGDKAMNTLLFIVGFLVYWFSLIGCMLYLNDKYFDFRFIYVIAMITPIWNTYLAIKGFCLRNFKPFIKSLKYHFFSWGDEKKK